MGCLPATGRLIRVLRRAGIAASRPHREEWEPMTTTATASTPPDELRARMIDAIVAARPTTSAPVEAAMRAVARHRFVPDAPIEKAYANTAVITKRAPDGTDLSCASLPSLVAAMLDNLHVEPGHQILEIGAGTGYNAALLAHLTGLTGHVTTIDIDPDVTDQARRALDSTGYGNVNVITRDGVLGAPEHAPYDRLIVTVGAWDIPTTWWDQLSPGGRLVVPLRWRGQTRAVAFLRDEQCWRSDWVELCGFVPMIGQDGEHTSPIHTDDQASLYWDDDQPITPQTLFGVLDQPATTVWSGATVGPNESFDGVWLRLTATEPGTCRIAAQPAAVESGLCTPAVPTRSPALVDGNSLAYFTLRRLPDHGDQRRWELGATGHGPTGALLARRLSDQIHAWDTDRTATPSITAYPVGVKDESAETTIAKPCIRLAISYQEAAE
jgi:protein-L-isoaspartate(D-aspartate) O-methyltransferase